MKWNEVLMHLVCVSWAEVSGCFLVNGWRHQTWGGLSGSCLFLTWLMSSMVPKWSPQSSCLVGWGLLVEQSVTLIVCVVSDKVVLNWSRRVSHQTAACQGIFRPEGDTPHDYSFSLFTVRSSNSIQASGTRQGLISGGCTVAPTVRLPPLCCNPDVWWSLDKYRLWSPCYVL